MRASEPTISTTVPSHLGLSCAALLHLPAPVVVVTASGHVVLANVSAKKELEDGLELDIGAQLHISNWGTCWTRGSHPAVVAWNDVLQASDLLPSRMSPDTGVCRRLLFKTVRPVVSTFELDVSCFVAEEQTHFILLLRTTTQATDESKPDTMTTTVPLSNSTQAPVLVEDFDPLPIIRQLRGAVFDSARTIAFAVSVDGKLAVLNEAAKEFVGPVAVSMMNHEADSLMKVFPAWTPDFTRELDSWERPGSRLIAGKENIPEETLGFVNTATGNRYVMRISGECLYDTEDHSFIGGLLRIREPMIVDDFVAHRRDLLISSFETMMNVMPHMVWRSTPEGLCDYFSSRWMEFTGLALEQSVGTGYMAAVHPADVERLCAEWGQALASAIECSFEVRFRRHDGLYKWQLVRAVPLKDSDGIVLAWYGTHTDVHEAVMSRKRNRRKWDQVLSVLAHAEVNLFAVDIEGTFSLSEGSLPWSWDEEHSQASNSILGTNILTAPHNGIPTDFQQTIKDILASRRTTTVSEYTIGAHTYRTRFIADYTQGESRDMDELAIQGCLGLSIDITDVKKRTALEIENASLQLEERTAQNASKMKSQFLANMSHEMRTPLAGVIGLVDLLIDTPLDDDQLEYVNNIRLSSTMLLSIVNDVLDFSKVESGRLDIEKVQFNLARNLKDLHQLLLPSCNRKELQLIYEGNIPLHMEMVGDPGRIRQVLLNLLTNAIKFTSNGSVTLSAMMEQEGDNVEVTFSVADTGIGIDKATLDQLFQPFRQGDSSTARLYGGTGLGLAISKNLAYLMNGRLDLESTPGLGSRATFVVPLGIAVVQGPSSTQSADGWTPARRPSRTLIDILTAQTSSKASPPPLRHGHSAPAVVSTFRQAVASSDIPQLSVNESIQCPILVVEDNAINQTIALKTIKKLGFTATAVWNGQEALDYIRSKLGSNSEAASDLPAIILMDVQMPIMDGYSATKAIRTMTPFKESEALQKVPIIALTASAIQGDLERCLSAGMNDYLAKPVSRKLLESMLTKHGLKRKLDESVDALDTK